ncbi:hypothetical protein C8Q72DRAFT_838353 [Fomitopsis betulina]|nr:hypothetical protein C8Q72DRAFT_838353 [Fomitopsis betulina]
MIDCSLGGGRAAHQRGPPEGPRLVKYGVSITDACVDPGVCAGCVVRQAVKQRRMNYIEAGLPRSSA